MNQKLQYIMETVQQSAKLDAEQKKNLIKAVKDADQELEITIFKLERTEKVKKTTAILLEETIEELEQKRKAVEAQNRELEIEAALERVRSIAMGMKAPGDMLEVCRTISLQLESLGVKEIRNVQTAIFKEHKDTYMNYEYYAKHKKTLITETTYTNHEIHHEFAMKMLKGKGEFFITHIKGEEVKNWIAYQKTTNVFIDNYLETASSLNYYWFSLGPVALGISTYHPLTEQEMALFRRFLSVFELAYRRYNDITLAEAQAREAQIELAMERVRSRAMAMHNSEDLALTVDVFFKELKSLNVTPRRCGVTLIDETTHVADLTVTTASGKNKDLKMTGRLKLSGHPVLDAVYENWKNQTEYHPVLKGDQIREYYAVMNPQIEYPDSTGDEIQYGHYFYFREGGVFAWTESQLSEEDIKIFRKFTSVLSLTYRRYIDLREAEDQAREAEIQLALERVRARTMAMHKSEELSDTASVLFHELKRLGIDSFRSGVCIFDYKIDSAELWLSTEIKGKTEIKIVALVNGDMHPMYKEWIEAGRQKKSLYIKELTGEEVFEYYEAVSEFLHLPPQQVYKKKEVYHGFFFDEGSLNVISLNRLSEDDCSIMLRFAKVFGLLYRRFLDLQKAETQAREAQIEAALEKVRSHSLAMHKSNELQEVVNTVFERLKDLNIDMNVASIFIFKEGSKDWEQWVATSTTNYSKYFHIPYTDNLVFKDLEEAKQKRRDFYSVRYSFDQKNEWFNYAFKNTDYRQIPDDRKKYILESKFFLVSFALSNHSGIQLAKYEGEDFSQDENDVLKRFSRVFEQAYVRFLDLQKAEAQAREALIEAALERVRSRTMGMQKSEELKEVIKLVYDQFVHLKINVDHAGFVVDYTPKGDWHFWIADQREIPSYITHPYFDSLWAHQFNEAKEKGTDFFATNLNFEEKNKFYHDLFKFIPGVPEESLDFYFNCPGLAGSTALLDNVGLYIENFSGIPYTNEDNNTLMRFGKVFQQTYTRFLDLQKAEAQAREAQIEVALERVRAKTMAMHKSDELAESAAVVFQQLRHLGIEPNRIYISILKDDKGLCEFWITDEDGTKVSSGFSVDLNENASFKKMYTGWKEKKESIIIDMQGKELRNYFKHLTGMGVPFKGGLSQKRRLQYIAYFSQGFIGVASPDETRPETLQLLERFAAVFNLTYTRFGDLQQAEAQNKIIQAENERKTRELEEARRLQLAMLPKEVPQLPHLEIAVHMKTATEVGGDYYDFSIKENGSLNICLGDATGHGMKAGIMVSSMKSIFTTNAAKMDIENFFSTANSGIKSMNLKRMMMGFTMVTFNGCKFRLINAGMPPVYLYRKKQHSVREIKEHGMPIGAMSQSQYKVTGASLNSGDVLLLLTDGMPELQNRTNEMFGYRRLQKCFFEIAEKRPRKIIEHLKDTAAQWSCDRDPEDDVTFVVIRAK